MIVSLQNSRQLFGHMGHANHQHPCKSEASCAGNDVIASMLRSMVNAHSHRNHTVRFRVTDQTESAIIYVAVVIVFYAAIIILLLGTSGRRPLRNGPKNRQREGSKDVVKQPTVAVYVDGDDRTEVQMQSNLEEEPPPPPVAPI